MSGDGEYDKATAIQARMVAAAEANYKLNKQKFDTWNKTFGNVQRQLGEYYDRVDGRTLSQKYITQQQRAYQASERKLEETVAQRGLQNSGYGEFAKDMMSFQNESNKYAIMANAEQMAMDKKMQFLALGKQSEAAMMGNLNQAGMAKLQAMQQQAQGHFKYGDKQNADVKFGVSTFTNILGAALGTTAKIMTGGVAGGGGK